MIKLFEFVPTIATPNPKTIILKEKYRTVEELLDAKRDRLEDNEIFTTSLDGKYLMLSKIDSKFWWTIGMVCGVDLRLYLPQFDEAFKE